MSRTPLVVFADICESVRYGYTASASEQEVGPRFLRITDIVPDSIDWDSVPFCEINDSDKEKVALEAGDIVVARTGATVGVCKTDPRFGRRGIRFLLGAFPSGWKTGRPRVCRSSS